MSREDRKVAYWAYRKEEDLVDTVLRRSFVVGKTSKKVDLVDKIEKDNNLEE